MHGDPTDPAWPWVALLVVYVALGYVFKSVLLNWIIGPLFPLIGLYLLPLAFGHRRGEAGPGRP